MLMKSNVFIVDHRVPLLTPTGRLLDHLPEVTMEVTMINTTEAATLLALGMGNPHHLNRDITVVLRHSKDTDLGQGMVDTERKKEVSSTGPAVILLLSKLCTNRLLLLRNLECQQGKCLVSGLRV
jgi:hypothetical protein